MYLDGFYTYLRLEKRYSSNTVDAYQNDLTQFSRFLAEEYQENDPDMKFVHHRQVRAWIVQLMDSGNAAKSVNRKISALKTYFRYLLREQAIAKNPMLKVVAPKTPKNLPLFVEKNSMNELFGLIETEYSEENEEQRFIKLRDRFILEMLYATGMRKGELLGLHENSFDRYHNTVKVLGKGNKERIIPISRQLIEMADEYNAEKKRLFGNSSLFIVSASGKKAYPKMIYNIVHKLLMNINTLTRKSPHVLRHTFATHLSNNGAELNAVKELLGHASLSSTQIYTHNTIDQLKKIHKRAHPKG